MHTASLTDAIADHVPTKSAAAALSSTWDEIADHLPEVDVSHAARRTRRALSRAVPGVQPQPTSSTRWLLITGVVVAVIAAVIVVRRRSGGEADQQRDDWSIQRDGDSRRTVDAEREPVTAPA